MRLTADLKQNDSLEDTLGRYESLLYVRRFVETPGIAGTSLASELMALLPSEGAFLKVGWRDAVSRIQDYFSKRSIVTIARSETSVPIRLLSLFCPCVPGAKATATIGMQLKNKRIASFEFFGSGGGKEVSLDVKCSDKFETLEVSIAVIYKILVEWDVCDLHGKTGAPVRFARISKIELKDSVVIEPIEIAHEDASHSEVSVIDLRMQCGSLIRKISKESGAQWSGTFGLKVSDFGIDAKLSYMATQMESIEYEYVLPGGYIYKVHQLDSSKDWFWSACK